MNLILHALTDMLQYFFLPHSLSLLNGNMQDLKDSARELYIYVPISIFS